MIKLHGYPVVAKYTNLNFDWNTTDNNDANFMGGTLLFDNINLVAGAGEISKGRTALNFNLENPIPWSDDTPQAVKDAFQMYSGRVKNRLRKIVIKNQQLLKNKSLKIIGFVQIR